MAKVPHIDDPAALGRRLSELRERRGISQRQIATEGCSGAYVSRIETGDRIPSPVALEYLADQLGTSVGWLANGTPDPWHAVFIDHGLDPGTLNQLERDVLARTLEDAERHAATVFAETLLETRVENARILYRNGTLAEDAAAVLGCGLQRLCNQLTAEDHTAHDGAAAQLAHAGGFSTS